MEEALSKPACAESFIQIKDDFSKEYIKYMKKEAFTADTRNKQYFLKYKYLNDLERVT